MVEIPISLTCADYARVMPLATGEVKPEGIALVDAVEVLRHAPLAALDLWVLHGARGDAPARGAGPRGPGRRVVHGAVPLPRRQGRSPLCRPARVSPAQLHGARPVHPSRWP